MDKSLYGKKFIWLIDSETGKALKKVKRLASFPILNIERIHKKIALAPCARFWSFGFSTSEFELLLKVLGNFDFFLVSLVI